MNDLVKFMYKNHRGNVSERHCRPIRMWFGSTAWYREPQWLLEMFDIDKGATRDFAWASFLGPVTQWVKE